MACQVAIEQIMLMWLVRGPDFEEHCFRAIHGAYFRVHRMCPRKTNSEHLKLQAISLAIQEFNKMLKQGHGS